MKPRPRAQPSGRRYGEDDNIPVQGLTGIGVVTAVTLGLTLVALGLAVIVSWFF